MHLSLKICLPNGWCMVLLTRPIFSHGCQKAQPLSDHLLWSKHHLKTKITTVKREICSITQIHTLQFLQKPTRFHAQSTSFSIWLLLLIIYEAGRHNLKKPRGKKRLYSLGWEVNNSQHKNYSTTLKIERNTFRFLESQNSVLLNPDQITNALSFESWTTSFLQLRLKRVSAKSKNWYINNHKELWYLFCR